MEQTRAVVVSTACDEADFSDTQPYRHACHALTPLLARWGATTEVTQPESRLDHALWQMRRQNREPLHLSFLPLHYTYLTQRAPTLAFSVWDFPDLPNADLAANPRNNYVSLANRLTLLLTPNTFTWQSFVQAGVQTPTQLVPVPVPSTYFRLPIWERDQHVVLECPCYRFPLPEAVPSAGAGPGAPAEHRVFRLRSRVREVYKEYVRPRLGAGLDRYLCLTRRVLAKTCGPPEDREPITHPASPRLEISGVPFTTVVNPFDPRDNWQDVLSAFLVAFRNQEDALLIVVLLAYPKQTAGAFNTFLRWYQKIGLRHRCKLAVVTSSLPDGLLLDLARVSAFFLQAPRARGLAMPLQSFLAAARPGISPVHTAMVDYFCDEVGFVVAAHDEPACWPRHPDAGYTTTWHRVVWHSLHEQLQRSYAIAKQDRARYEKLAERARARLLSWASDESVWPRLAAALNRAERAARTNTTVATGKRFASVARAS